MGGARRRGAGFDRWRVRTALVLGALLVVPTAGGIVGTQAAVAGSGASEAVATSVAPGDPVTSLDAGDSSTCAGTDTGRLWCWGNGDDGRLGTGSLTPAAAPTSVAVTGTVLAGQGITSVGVGDTHACAVGANGAAACWGAGTSGRLGSGSTASASTPQTVVTAGALAGASFTAIAAGSSHTCALTATRAVACWGANSNGQVGDASTTTRTSPVLVNVTGTPLEGQSVAKIGAGFNFSCALTAAGAIACWGSNSSGALGISTATTQATKPTAIPLSAALAGKVFVDLAVGYSASCALASDGTVVCWGDNSYYVLGSTASGNAPRAIPVTGGLTGRTVDRLMMGKYFGCAHTTDANILCWGDNRRSVLGNDTDPYRATPQPVPLAGSALAGATVTVMASGSAFACAGTSTGALVCWGNNEAGQLGTGVSGRANKPAAAATGVFTTGSISQLSRSWDASCGVVDAKVACWGDNASGQIADKTLVPSPVPKFAVTTGTPLAGKTIARVSTAAVAVCALATDSSIACWGTNWDGQIGNNFEFTSDMVAIPTTGTPLAGKTLVDIEAGGTTQCVLATDSTIGCWGAGTYGQLGNGGTTSSSVPVAVTRTGTPLAGKTVKQLAGTGSAMCALTTDSVIACWGSNGSSALGNNSTTNSSVPVAVTTAGTPLAGKTIASIDGANLQDGFCAVATDGVAACWGSNQGNALGDGTSTTRKVPTAIATSGTVLAGKAIAQIAGGNSWKCARTVDHVLACWGQNWSGQLGNGGGPTVSTPVAVDVTGTPLEGKALVELVAGDYGACARTIDGIVSCWGQNERGELGNGTVGYVVGPKASALLPPPIYAPGAPTAVVASSDASGTATVTWSAPTSDGGSPITGYQIVPTIGGVAQSPVSVPGTGTSKTLTGLSNGTAHTFQVSATNAVGTGSLSAASNPVTPMPDPTAPGAPAIDSVVPGDAQVTVNWSAPASDGGSPITGYVVTPSIAGVAQPSTATAGDARSVVINGLTNGTAHRFTVAAVNAVGSGTESAPSAPVTPARRPDRPTDVTATAGSERATVSWTAPSSDGGSPITGYEVVPWAAGVAQPPRTFGADATSRVVTGLTNGTSYRFTVRATSASGTSDDADLSAAVVPAGVVVTSNVAPSVFGQNVALKATITGGTTGSVWFYDGATLLGTKTVSLGVATYPTTKLTVGSHSITASYLATPTSTAIVSDPFVQVVDKGAASVALTSPTEPSVWGQAVKIKATVTAVAPAVGIPGGTVVFREGTTVIGTVTLTSGAASLTVKPTVGAHTYSATYSGSGNFLGAGPATLDQHVVQAATTTALSSNANPSVSGQSVTIKATVKTSLPGSGTPTGTVDLYDDDVLVATKALSGGVASFSGQKPSVGEHRYVAVFRGSANSIASISGDLVQTVGKASTKVTVTSSAATATAGQTGLVTATVAVLSPGSGSTAGGVVEFREGSSVIATVSVSGGKATIRIASLAPGVHDLTATYLGIDRLEPSTSLPFRQTIV